MPTPSFGVAAEETPQDGYECDYRHAGDDVEAIGAEKSRRTNFEEEKKPEQEDDALHWTTSHDPHWPAGYMRQFLIRCKFRYGFWWSSSRRRGPLHCVRSAALPAVSIFILDSVTTVATAPHNGDR
jgi:hypothetical protein